MGTPVTGARCPQCGLHSQWDRNITRDAYICLLCTGEYSGQAIAAAAVNYQPTMNGASRAWRDGRLDHWNEHCKPAGAPNVTEDDIMQAQEQANETPPEDEDMRVFKLGMTIVDEPDAEPRVVQASFVEGVDALMIEEVQPPLPAGQYHTRFANNIRITGCAENLAVINDALLQTLGPIERCGENSPWGPGGCYLPKEHKGVHRARYEKRWGREEPFGEYVDTSNEV